MATKKAKRAPAKRVREKLTKFDAVDHLRTEEDIASYLAAAMDEGGDDAEYIAAVLGDIAKARGIMSLAEATGITRAGLYKALGEGGNPSFATILKVTRALGLKLVPQRAV